MLVTINGEKHELHEGATVAEALAALGIRDCEGVAVELDGAFVEREEYAETRLAEDSSLELIRFVGGG
jgi:sulfur carrier protein